MPRYLKIPANPDSSPCRCTSGDPDCDHFEFCPECGAEYKEHEGHDCLDGVPIQDMRDLTKALRDACETERDRLRAELDAAHDGEDALRSEGIKLRAQIAALQPEERRVGPDEVVVGREEWEAVQEFADLIVPIRDNLSGISWIGKISDVFAAYDRWYAVRISAQALQPEERRVGADEVVVSREEWEVIEQILKVSAICANEGGTDRHCCMQTDDHHIPLTRIRAIRALRTSAQAPGQRGEG